jgi:hypothetical protein
MRNPNWFPAGLAGFGILATLALSSPCLAGPASARKTPVRPQAPQVAAEQASAARRMDERIARHDATAKRAMVGICAGC